VRLEEKIVNCCRNGCMAYTAKHAQATSCPSRKVERCSSPGNPAKTTWSWNISPWMAMMLADPDMGPDMTKLN